MLLVVLSFLLSLWDPPPMMSERLQEVVRRIDLGLLEYLIEDASPRYEIQRSGRWSGVRKIHLGQSPICRCCGGDSFIEVHHILPYHQFPELELVLSNLITLCDNPARRCHFMFGHLGNWRSWNTEVREDAARHHSKILNRPNHEKPVPALGSPVRLE